MKWISKFFRKRPKREIDFRHHYRWDYRYERWMHTGLIYYKDGTLLGSEPPDG